MELKPFSAEALLGPLNDVEKKHAPKTLYAAGDPALARTPSVSIVGSRKATVNGLRRAERLARILVDREVAVVSGLADGIDTAVHRAAIDHGGRTVAVLGTPLDEVYPRKNEALQHLIMRDHLAVSQFAPGTPTTRKNFPLRNRTMALLSDATAIIEARDGSGSLHQAWEAIRLGRPLFITQTSVDDRSLSWPAELCQYGAQVLSNESIELIFELLPVGGRDDEASSTPF
jgi:DNA processing protein